MFIFGVRKFRSRCAHNQKSAPKKGVDLWRRFLERVSWALGFITGSPARLAAAHGIAVPRIFLYFTKCRLYYISNSRFSEIQSVYIASFNKNRTFFHAILYA